MSRKSMKCLNGDHTECIFQPEAGYGGDMCSCQCHELDDQAREVLTRMCQNTTFRDKMMSLVYQAMERERRVRRA